MRYKLTTLFVTGLLAVSALAQTTYITPFENARFSTTIDPNLTRSSLGLGASWLTNTNPPLWIDPADNKVVTAIGGATTAMTFTNPVKFGTNLTIGLPAVDTMPAGAEPNGRFVAVGTQWDQTTEILIQETTNSLQIAEDTLELLKIFVEDGVTTWADVEALVNENGNGLTFLYIDNFYANDLVGATGTTLSNGVAAIPGIAVNQPLVFTNATNAAATRTNLGLGGSWLTNTNMPDQAWTSVTDKPAWLTNVTETGERILGASAEFPVNVMRVFGTGTQIDGDYPQVGTTNGRPRYQILVLDSNGYPERDDQIYFTGAQWEVSSGGVLMGYGMTNAATPDVITNWNGMAGLAVTNVFRAPTAAGLAVLSANDAAKQRQLIGLGAAWLTNATRTGTRLATAAAEFPTDVMRLVTIGSVGWDPLLTGDYPQVGTTNGRPRYLDFAMEYGLVTRSNEILWTGTNWWLVTGGVLVAASLNQDVATPDLVTGWMPGYSPTIVNPAATPSAAGLAMLSASNVAAQRLLVGLGVTNDAAFGSVSIGALGNANPRLSGEPGFIGIYDTIDSEYVLKIPSDTDPVEINSQWNNADVRSNLGLGASWLTNTNPPIYADINGAVITGRTNALVFSNPVTVTNLFTVLGGGGFGTQQITIGNAVINGWNDLVPATFQLGVGGLTFSADTAKTITRGNLGLGPTNQTQFGAARFNTDTSFDLGGVGGVIEVEANDNHGIISKASDITDGAPFYGWSASGAPTVKARQSDYFDSPTIFGFRDAGATGESEAMFFLSQATGTDADGGTVGAKFLKFENPGTWASHYDPEVFSVDSFGKVRATGGADLTGPLISSYGPVLSTTYANNLVLTTGSGSGLFNGYADAPPNFTVQGFAGNVSIFNGGVSAASVGTKQLTVADTSGDLIVSYPADSSVNGTYVKSGNTWYKDGQTADGSYLIFYAGPGAFAPGAGWYLGQIATRDVVFYETSQTNFPTFGGSVRVTASGAVFYGGAIFDGGTVSFTNAIPDFVGQTTNAPTNTTNVFRWIQMQINGTNVFVPSYR